MDILEFINIYLDSSDDVKVEIEEILNILSERPYDPAVIERIAYIDP